MNIICKGQNKNGGKGDVIGQISFIEKIFGLVTSVTMQLRGVLQLEPLFATQPLGLNEGNSAGFKTFSFQTA